MDKYSIGKQRGIDRRKQIHDDGQPSLWEVFVLSLFVGVVIGVIFMALFN